MEVFPHPITSQPYIVSSHVPHPHLTFLQSLVLVLEERDAEELVLVLAGYFNLATDLDLAVTHVKSTSDEQCEYNLRAILLHEQALGYFGDFGYIRPFYFGF